MSQGRFSGSIGEEYRLFALAVPWHDEFQQKITTHFQMWAGFYQEMRWLRQSDLYAPCSPRVLDVVELGCGTGFTTDQLLRSYPLVHVTAIDNESVMIEQATALFVDDSRVAFQVNDVLAALQSMSDGSVDAVVSAYVLHNLQPAMREAVVAEAVRVLRPGGLFINGDKYARYDLAQHARDLEDQISAFTVFDQIGRSDLREEWTAHYHEDEQIAWGERTACAHLASLQMVNVGIVYRQRMEAIIVATKP